MKSPLSEQMFAELVWCLWFTFLSSDQSIIFSFHRSQTWSYFCNDLAPISRKKLTQSKKLLNNYQLVRMSCIHFKSRLVISKSMCRYTRFYKIKSWKKVFALHYIKRAIFFSTLFFCNRAYVSQREQLVPTSIRVNRDFVLIIRYWQKCVRPLKADSDSVQIFLWNFLCNFC